MRRHGLHEQLLVFCSIGLNQQVSETWQFFEKFELICVGVEPEVNPVDH